MHGCSDNVVTGRNHGDDLSGKSSPLFSQATTFVGTTRYMSPERLDGQPYEQQELSLLQLSTQPPQQQLLRREMQAVSPKQVQIYQTNPQLRRRDHRYR